jgi:hypothetical protein
MVETFLWTGKFLANQSSPQFCSRNGIFDKKDSLLYLEQVVEYLKVMKFVFLPYEVKFENIPELMK